MITHRLRNESSRRSSKDLMTKGRLVAALGVMAVLALRVTLIFRYRIDSDEPQHLHVAWGWAHGLVQYRDLFDNHMPLFHLLSAPLFLWDGDNPRVLYAARLFVLPLFIAAVALIASIGTRLFGQRRGIAAAAITAAMPPFFLITLEYRTDDLWVVLWLAAIAIAISGVSFTRRALLTGLFLGIAFAVSMKTTLLVIAIGGAAVLTLALTWRHAPLPPRSDLVRAALLGAAACAIPPTAVAVAYALGGAWRPFRYDIVTHNVIPYEHSWRVLWFVPWYAVTRTASLRVLGSGIDAPLLRRRLFVVLACAIYGTAMSSFWPMLEDETFLPLYATTALALFAIIAAVPIDVPHRRALAALCLATELVLVVVIATPWQNEAADEEQLVAEAVALTPPNEPLLDLKGETLFRSRACYLVLEGITNRKLRIGMLRDRIEDELVRTATHVVATDRLPYRARRFVEANYVPWGRLRVAGFRLPPLAANDPFRFEVKIAGKYALIGNHGVVEVSLDGAPPAARLTLRRGWHSAVATESVEKPLLLWSRALDVADFAERRSRALREADEPRFRERVVALEVEDPTSDVNGDGIPDGAS